MLNKPVVLITLLVIMLALCSCVHTQDKTLRTTDEGSLQNPTSVPPSAQTQQTPYPYLFSVCPTLTALWNNMIVNGGFEQGEYRWSIHSTGTGSTWQAHPLIGSGGLFQPHSGTASARLGGYEGSLDQLQQTVIIPPKGLLTYWWQINQRRAKSRLSVSLVELDGSNEITLTAHTDEDSMDGWHMDCIDLSSFSEQEYILEFNLFNDNYTQTSFDIDDIFLGSLD